MIEIVETAASKVGGLVALARKLGISHQSFYSWRRIPAERVIEIEKATGIPRQQLRPDLYPAKPDKQKVRAA
jgi:DNA-binding transcriptional regulator YdaS (Cro superfamily)